MAGGELVAFRSEGEEVLSVGLGGGLVAEELVAPRLEAGELLVLEFDGGELMTGLLLAAAFLSASHCSTGICPVFSGQYHCPWNCVCPEPVKSRCML